MIVRTLHDLKGTDRDVSGPGWESRRFLLKDDGFGYSLHDTVVKEGSELELHYKHHIEANYCFGGEGEVVDVATGAAFPIKAGTLYALDRHDRHIVRALKGDLRLVCIFTPALSGRETHRADGSYAPADD
jgi:L-ectoine synthase